MSAALSVHFPQDLTTLRDLYHRARFLDAHEILQTYSPPEMWPDPEARILAGRFLENLGASRRGVNLLRETWRAHPKHPEALYYHALGLDTRHGAFEALRFIEELQPDAKPSVGDTPPTKDEVHLWLLRARLLAQFRDFEASEQWLQASLKALPEDPWARVEESHIRHLQDRVPEALAAVERARQLRPNYRPAINMSAFLLMQQNRDDEAIALLKDALQTMQAGSMAQQLVGLYIEQERFAEALNALDLARRFLPLAEKPTLEWERSRRADLAYRLGNYNEAVEAARKVSSRYYETFAKRLEEAARAPAMPRRVVCSVGFVRQHHMTCAPATLSALSVFWKRPIDHLELAKVITYDGTPDHEERFWLESQGWQVREFRVTWDTARALIDRGVPFTLVTTWIRSAHLQAVIGYDDAVGTLIIRDPSYRSHTEALAVELLEQQAPHGPRGMVMLPPEEAHRLEGVELPETELYDAWFKLRRALEVHDRSTAEQAAQAIEAKAPGHRFAWQARRALAYYDDNPLRVHEAIEALRKLYPNEPNLRLEELAALDRLGRRAERLQRLREFAHSPGADPVFWREYAEQLRSDARENRRAMRYARRLMRVRPVDWLNLSAFAHLLWDSGEFKNAARVYRLAATVGEKVEAPWSTFFNAARLTNDTDTALQLLRERWSRLSHASAFPTQTLCRALDQLNRNAESHDILEQSLAQRPDDSDLLLFAADSHGRVGQFAQAQEKLRRARDRSHRLAWMHTAAYVATWRGEHAEALALWKEILAANPLNAGAIRETARHIALLHGRDQALAWLAAEVERFPHFLPLRQTRLEWLRSAAPADALAEVEQYLQLEPQDAWALREKALIQIRARQHEAALETAKLAEQIEPRAPLSPGLVGQALLALRRFPEAREATERALRISIDADWLMPQLMQACPTFEERKAAVEFLRSELATQASHGNGFLAFQDAATGILSGEELHRAIESLRAAQPTHWEIWAAAAQQTVAIGKLDDALTVAEEGTKRFPLVPRLWLELADVRRARNETDAEIAALKKAREISPGWSWATSRLATVYLRSADLEAAEDVLRGGLRYDPLDPRLTAEHARVLWQLRRTDAALEQIERAIGLAPAYGLPWSLLAQWARELGQPEKVIVVARKLAEQRAGDPEPLWRLAQELAGADKFVEALAEIDAALRLDATHINSHDFRAVLLAQLGRYDDALLACAPLIFGSETPHTLRGRGAWVDWRRGNHKQAVAQLRLILADHPDYSWGWQTLADWLDAIGETKNAAEAAERYAALNPGSPAPLGYIGDLRRKAGEKKRAAEAFREALRLDPNYLFAAMSLLEFDCEFSEWKEAEQVLELIRKHASKWQALRAEVLVRRWRRDEAAALRAMEELALAPEHDTPLLANAAQLLMQGGFSRELARSLQKVWANAGVNPEVGAIWIRAYRDQDRRPPLRRLLKGGASAETKQRALGVYLEWLGESKSWIRISWLIWRQRELLRASNQSWGSAAYALSHLGLSRFLVRWMADWRTREQPEPWMLYYLAGALFELKRDEAALAVVRRALELPADQSRPTLVAWSALYAALGDDFESAKRWISVFEAPENFYASRAVAERARALIELRETPAEKRREKFHALRRRLATDVIFSIPGAHGLGFVRRAQRLTLRKLARLADSTVWEWWYRIQPPKLALNPEVMRTVGAVALILLVVVGLAALAAQSGNTGSFGGLWLIVALISGLVRGSRRK